MISKKIFFFHIPKTAGTSVTVAMMQRFPHERICPYAHREELEANDISKLKQWDFFRGHLPLSICRQIPRLFVFTFLRNPVERALSEYHYVTAQRQEIEEEIQEKKCTNWCVRPMRVYEQINFKEAVGKRPDYIMERLNFQTGWLAGKGEAWIDRDKENMNTLRIALANMKKIDFVGLVEHMDISLILLSWRLQIPLLSFPQLYKVNQNRPKGGWRQELVDMESELIQIARMDQSLYAVAKERLTREWEEFCGEIKMDSRRKLDESGYMQIEAFLNQRAENKDWRAYLASHLRQLERKARTFRKKIW
ncbi:MAG: sulfotransferase family protein [Verrucomicrobiales bacterium]|jgi:hypothetical protein|nr:sulfotransferase family protein [Verrucomicrobiales bacterium]